MPIEYLTPPVLIPRVAEVALGGRRRVVWRGQQPSGDAYRFLSCPLHIRHPHHTPVVTRLEVSFTQGQILAVWILPAKLPNSDLNFAVDFLVDFFLLFSPRKNARKKIHQKIPRKIHPGLCREKFPSDFCRSLLLTFTSDFKSNLLM